MADTYKIVRFYLNRPEAPGHYSVPQDRRRTVVTSLTLEEAQAHCQDPETSWKTCTKAAGKRRTKTHGAWFDGYTKE